MYGSFLVEEMFGEGLQGFLLVSLSHEERDVVVAAAVGNHAYGYV